MVPEDSLEQLFVRLLPHIDRVIAWLGRRHRLSAVDADDFAQGVKLKFIENDYAILRRFQERSSLATFVTSVVTNAFHDWRNDLWGKYRPSAEARRQGPLAVLLEQHMVRDARTFDDACQLIAMSQGPAADRAELERILAKLRLRVRRRMESDEVLENVVGPGSSDQSVLENERRALGRKIWGILNRVLGQLPAEDAAILALKFKGGKRVSEIAVSLRLQQRPLYNRITALLKRLRDALESEGIDSRAIGRFLDEDF